MYTFELLLRLPEKAPSGALDGPLAAEASRLAAILPLEQAFMSCTASATIGRRQWLLTAMT